MAFVAGVESDRVLAVEAMLDPVAVVRGLVEHGADGRFAVEVAANWFAYLKTQVLPVSKRQLRSDLFFAEGRAYGDRPGGCYLRMVRLSRRKKVWNLLGPNPSLQMVMEVLEAGDFDNDAIGELVVVPRAGNIHVEYAHLVHGSRSETLATYLTYACEANGWRMHFSSASYGKVDMPVHPQVLMGVDFAVPVESGVVSELIPVLTSNDVIIAEPSGRGVIGAMHRYIDNGQHVYDDLGAAIEAHDVVIMSLERYLYRFNDIQCRAIVVVCDKFLYNWPMPQVVTEASHYAVCFDTVLARWVVAHVNDAFNSVVGHVDVEREWNGLPRLVFGNVRESKSALRDVVGCRLLGLWLKRVGDCCSNVYKLGVVPSLIQFGWAPLSQADCLLAYWPVCPGIDDKFKFDVSDKVDLDGAIVMIAFTDLAKYTDANWKFDHVKLMIIAQAPLWQRQRVLASIAGLPVFNVFLETLDLHNYEHRYVSLDDYYMLQWQNLVTIDVVMAAVASKYGVAGVLVEDEYDQEFAELCIERAVL